MIPDPSAPTPEALAALSYLPLLPEGHPDLITGWEDIAKHMGVSVKTARAWAMWGVEHRLPVFDDRVKPRARRSKLDLWKLEELMPHGLRQRIAPPPKPKRAARSARRK